jgi:alcohol dehydrogenase class IV
MEVFAEHCGFGSVDAMISEITKLKKLGGLPMTLEDAGIGKDDVETLIDESFHPLMNNNPQKVDKEDLRKIYTELGA